MKKIIILLAIIIILLLSAYWFISKTTSPSSTLEESKDVLGAPKAQSIPGTDFQFQDHIYTAVWFEIKNTDRITLSSNLAQKSPASELHTKNNCQYLTNAGFYTKENIPIGLFLSEGQMIRVWSQNSLFNGVFSINSFATPRITRTQPKDELRLALQTGPILIENASPKTLSINNDKPARRIILATTGANTTIFLAIYTQDSAFNGPLLADLPQVLQALMDQSSISIADAINLDGGTASAFYAPDFELSELSPIGSYFCIK